MRTKGEQMREFCKINDNIAQTISALVGEGSFHTGEMIGADYGHDELPGGAAFMPDAVVEATSTDEVSEILKLCNESNIPVTVRGAGTGKVGGSVPIKGGIELSLKAMDSIIAFDEDAKTLTVQPGVLLQDVKLAAAEHGMYYPPDPGEKTACIGGNVATDAGGPCAFKYGSTRDYVLDAVLVLADGTIRRLSQNAELSAVIGSEGTLAVITEITLKLVDKPACDAILLLPFMDSESCINAAIKLSECTPLPATLEYLDTDIVEFSGKVTGSPVFPVEVDGERAGATLMLTIESDSDDELDEQMEAVAEMAEELEPLDIFVVDTPTLKRDVWAAHDAFHTSMETVKCSDELNITVPMDKICEQIDFAKALGAELGIDVYTYAHVGSGGLHIHMAAETKDSFADFAKAVYSKCVELGGDVRGEYGMGYIKTAYSSAKFAALKQKFDPKGILNPGKIV